MGDQFGKRRIFLVGITIFTLASVACGLAQTPGQPIAVRAVQGVGGALLVLGSLAEIGASFTEEGRGKAIGTWSGFFPGKRPFGDPLLSAYSVAAWPSGIRSRATMRLRPWAEPVAKILLLLLLYHRFVSALLQVEPCDATAGHRTLRIRSSALAGDPAGEERSAY